MLRLFSSVRKTLINEGKTSRYVRYAVGEFLLIVAGILVALQIQTWNEERKLEQQRQELIENLKVDFMANLQNLNEITIRVEEVLNELDTYLAVAGKDTSGLDFEELQALTHSGFRGVDFRPALSTYKTALSTGSYGLLMDNKLKELFINFENHYEEFEEMAAIHNEMNFIGEIAELRQNLGSLRVLRRSQSDQPEVFRVTDEEYRKIFSSKEVYAIYESKRILRGRQQNDLKNMKEISQQILTALESLD